MTWNFSDISGIYAAYPQNTAGNGSSDSNKSSSSSDHSNKHSNSDSNNSSNDDDDDSEEQDNYDEVYLHCTTNVINKYGADKIVWFVRLVKDEIEPRAIAALIEGFPAFKKAADKNEISSKISLYIYDDSVDKKKQDERVLENAFGYASGYYDDKGIFKVMIGINLNDSLDYNDGKYAFKQGMQTQLENTLVHELMHGFMDDYNRTGMSSQSKENMFPDWFIEGSAQTVAHSLGAYKDELDTMLDKKDKYAVDDITKFFSKKENAIDRYRYEPGKDQKGTYFGGYFACVYLGVKASRVDGDFSSEDVRRGLNEILECLHGGVSLDEIIRHYTEYQGIVDFEKRFLKEGDSAEICTELLNNLLEIERKNGVQPKGSILMDFDTTTGSPIETRNETSEGQKTLVIIDENKEIPSTADDKTARVRSMHGWKRLMEWLVMEVRHRQKQRHISVR